MRCGRCGQRVDAGNLAGMGEIHGQIVNLCESCYLEHPRMDEEPPIVMGGQGHDAAELVEAGTSLALMAALVVVTLVIAMLRGA